MMNLRTGKGVLNRMRRILESPVDGRRSRFGRGWAWDLFNGEAMIREQWPELIPEMQALQREYAPRTISDLTPIYP